VTALRRLMVGLVKAREMLFLAAATARRTVWS